MAGPLSGVGGMVQGMAATALAQNTDEQVAAQLLQLEQMIHAWRVGSETDETVAAETVEETVIESEADGSTATSASASSSGDPTAE